MFRRLLALAVATTLLMAAFGSDQAHAQIDADATPVVDAPRPGGDSSSGDDADEPDTPRPIDSAQQIPLELEPAGQYCNLRDGIVVVRFPFARIASASPVPLDGSLWFCEFTGSAEAEPPSSRISISLTTLYATQPTLAGSAYLAAPLVDDVPTTATAAEFYCEAVGGSSRFGIEGESTGGWASDIDDPANTSISICMFPDGSAIDDWGLYYRSVGTIRGADLQTALRQPIEPDVIEIFTTP